MRKGEEGVSMKLIKLKMHEDGEIGCIRADRIEGVTACKDCDGEGWRVHIKLTCGDWIEEGYPDRNSANVRYTEIVKAIAKMEEPT